jgi:hypothetical protein
MTLSKDKNRIEIGSASVLLEGSWEEGVLAWRVTREDKGE